MRDVFPNSAVQVPLTYLRGDVLRARTPVSVAPTTLRLEVWKKGTVEPTAWTVVRTDTTTASQRLRVPHHGAGSAS